MATDSDPADESVARRPVRRIERNALGIGFLAAIVAAVSGELRTAAILTGVVVASIVSLRGLELQVDLLEPREDGRLGPRNFLLILLRYSLFGLFVMAATLFGSRDFVALLLGLSALPAALLLEAFLQWAGSAAR